MGELSHNEVSLLLPDYAAELLSSRRRRVVEQHLLTCEECQSWLETFDLLAAGLTDSSSQRHPDSLFLCQFVLEGQNLAPAEREACSRHLRRCAQCRHEAKLVGASIADAAGTLIRSADVAPASLLRRLAQAAALILAIGGTLLLGHTLTPTADEYRLVGHNVAESRVVTAGRQILVEATAVQKGSSLTLQGPAVAFGEGFSVDTDAELTVIDGNDSGTTNQS